MSERRCNVVAGLVIGILVLNLISMNIEYIQGLIYFDEMKEVCNEEGRLLRAGRGGADDEVRKQLIELYAKKRRLVHKAGFNAIQVKTIEEECDVRIVQLESKTETWWK